MADEADVLPIDHSPNTMQNHTSTMAMALPDPSVHHSPNTTRQEISSPITMALPDPSVDYSQMAMALPDPSIDHSQMAMALPDDVLDNTDITTLHQYLHTSPQHHTTNNNLDLLEFDTLIGDNIQTDISALSEIDYQFLGEFLQINPQQHTQHPEQSPGASNQVGCGEPIHVCQICSKTCKTKAGLTKHMKQCKIDQNQVGEPIHVCQMCSKRCKTKAGLSKHKKCCKVLKTNKSCNSLQIQCQHCLRICKTKTALMQHVKRCNPDKKFTCQTCHEPHTSATQLKKHIYRKHRTHKKMCRICGELFANRRELYMHKADQHGRGGLQDRPWQLEEDALWNEEGVANDSLRRNYQVNEQHILRPHEEGALRMTYNFPTLNLQGGLDEIMDRVREIYRSESSAFKINLSLGIILQNLEDNDFRYFVPYDNTALLDHPHTIARLDDLSRLERKLSSLNLEDYIHEQRENSQWKPHVITNVNFYVYRLAYPLGEGFLPNYIKNRTCIISHEADSNDKMYEDNLCAFRCLLSHRNVTATMRNIKPLYEQWRVYNSQASLPDDPLKFKGLDFYQIPDFESCFDTGINLYDLQPEGAVIPKYLTSTTHQSVMYLNMHEHHLSYVKTFSV